MIIFIGGPPRVGKTILAKQVAKTLGYSLVTSDALRQGAVKLKSLSKKHPLLAMISRGEWDDCKTFYSKYSPKQIIKLQNTESKEVSKLVKGFVEAIPYEELGSYVFEGVALMPSFYPKKFLKRYQIKFYCVGNTDYKNFVSYSWKNRSKGDWLEGENQETFARVIKYCVEFSKFIKKEAAWYSLPYFEISSKNFKKDIKKIADKIINP